MNRINNLAYKKRTTSKRKLQRVAHLVNYNKNKSKKSTADENEWHCFESVQQEKNVIRNAPTDEMDKISSKWRPLRGRANKSRKASRRNLITARIKRMALLLKSKEKLTTEKLESFQKLNLKKEPIHSVNGNSVESTSYNTVDVNEDELKMTNIVKEEIDIKEEIYDDFMIETTENDMTCDVSSSELNPFANNSYSNLITRKFPLKQVDLIPNSNYVPNEIENPLRTKAIEGIFSSSEKHVKQMPKKADAPRLDVFTGCTRCRRVFDSQIQLDNHREVDCWSYKKKKIYNGKHIRICSKCNTSTKSNSMGKCSECSGVFHLKCKKCEQMFANYDEFSHHHSTQCIPRGYFHCPLCDFKSRYSNYVRSHIFNLHPDLVKSNPNLDIYSCIEWKDVAKDAKGNRLPLHICTKCCTAFKNMRSFNQHVRYCRKTQIFDSVNPHDNDRKVVLNCEECNRDVKYYLYYRQQPHCTDCQRVLKFKCTLCGKLMNHDVCAVVHAKSTCGARQKLYICNVCGISFESSESLLGHEKQHSKTSDQEVEVPLEHKSLGHTDNFVQNALTPDESENQLDLREDILLVPVKREESCDLFSCLTCYAKFEQDTDFTRHSKYCGEKLQMQCKVLLTRLKVD